MAQGGKNGRGAEEEKNDFMVEIIQAQYTQYEMDVKPAGPFWRSMMGQETATGNILNFIGHVQTTYNDSKATWEFIDNLDLERTHSVTSILQKGKECDQERERLLIHSWRHDFVSMALSRESTDRRIGEAFGEFADVGDDGSRLTPDFIIQDVSGIYHVFEIGTTRIPETMESKYQEKLFKYESAIQERCINGVKAVLEIIIVSPRSVLSSTKLNLEICEELCTRLAIMLAVEDDLVSKGIFPTETAQESELNMKMELIQHQIKINSEKIKPKTPFLGITDNLVERIKSEKVDQEKVLKYFLNERENVKKERIIRDKRSSRYKMEKYLKTQKKVEGAQTVKPFLNMPLILLPQSKTETTDVKYRAIGTCPTSPALGRVWRSAMNSLDDSPNFQDENLSAILAEAYCQDPIKVKEFQEARKERRNKYHRINIKQTLDQHDLRELAMDGVWAKKYSKEEWLKARRMDQKRPVAWDVNNIDIDDFIKNKALLGKTEVLTTQEKVMDLIALANKSMDNNLKQGEKMVRSWMETKLFQGVDLQCDIALELAISNKQNCSGGNMILKKIRHRNVYALICPTRSVSHTFFSLFYSGKMEKLAEKPFRAVHKCEGGSIADFVSFSAGKIENWANASAFLLSMATFWAWFYELEDSTPESFLGNDEALKMLLLSLLIRLEDKAQTEEVITQSRYMYMEVLKSKQPICPADPGKIIAKLPEFYRSRLAVWCANRLVKTFILMDEDVPERTKSVRNQKLVAEAGGDVRVLLEDHGKDDTEGEDGLPDDHWTGLLNFFTGEPVHNLSKLVNLFYVGYVKNKNETAQGNTDFHLINKTVEEELKFCLEEVERSTGERDDFTIHDGPKPKQYSFNSILYGSRLLAAELKRKLGPNWQDKIEREILRKLARAMTADIATLKASSSLKHTKFEQKVSLADNPEVSRIKVIEAFSELIHLMKQNPFLSLGKFLDHIEGSNGGVIADLFKKQQHGGLREIYVLTPYSRIMQLFVETCSRVICSYFEEETLTHPENKMKLLDEHKTRGCKIAYSRDCYHKDFCSSSDKTRWNQNLVMPAMAIPLLSILPAKFHGLIQRTLNMWSKKAIKLPTSVCTLMLSGTELSSPVYKEMKKEFLTTSHNGPSTEEPRLFHCQYDSFVHLSTGMMQGILHFTSSLLHLTLLHTCKTIGIQILTNEHPACCFTMTSVCSSDDSATILTVFGKGSIVNFTREDMNPFYAGQEMLETFNKMAPYFCMVNSAKSVTGLCDYVEFNSDFLFKNTLAVPIIKFVAASLGITESESFLNRQHQLYGLMSDVMKAGLPAQHTHIVQLSQAYLHYKTMGMNISAVFPEYHKKIQRAPDPMLGFFLLDSELVPGVIGFSYSAWKTAKATNTIRRSTKTSAMGDFVTGPDGSLVESLVVRHGEHVRWTKLQNRVSGGLTKKAIEEIIQEKKEVLYREARNESEVKIQLMAKAISAGVCKSLNKGNPFLQALALSVYSFNTHCFSRSNLQTTESEAGIVKRSKKVEKTSLLGELSRRIEEVEGENTINNNHMSKEVLELMYPNSSRYPEIEKIISSYDGAVLLKSAKIRQRRTMIIIQPTLTSLPVSLLAACRHMWFDIDCNVSSNVLKRCWSTYQEIAPWLSMTCEESLINSPFSNHVELHSFISTATKRCRSFCRIGPGANSQTLTGQISQLIRKSQKESYILERSVDNKIRTTIGSNLKTKLCLALAIPEEKTRERESRNIIERNESICTTKDDLKTLGSRDFALGCIQLFARGKMDPKQISESMYMLRTGCIVTFPTEQRQRQTVNGKKIWVGSGECFIRMQGLDFTISIFHNMALKIVTSDLKELQKRTSMIRHMFREMDLTGLNTARLQLYHDDLMRDGTIDYSDGNMRLKPEYLEIENPNSIAARFDGLNLIPPRSHGTPVYIDTTRRIGYADIDKMRIDYGHGNISLKQISSGRETTILKYYTSDHDLEIKDKSPTIGDKSLWHSWINQNKIKTEKAIEHLAYLSDCVDGQKACEKGRFITTKGMPDRDGAKKKEFDWLIRSLKCRLQTLQLGAVSHQFSKSIATEDIEPPVHNLIEGNEETPYEMIARLMAIGPKFFAENFEDMEGEEEFNLGGEIIYLPKDEGEEIKNKLVETVDVVGNQIFDMVKEHAHPAIPGHTEVIGRSLNTFMHQHPLWDDLIYSLKEENPRFWEMTLDGNVTHEEAEMSEQLMKWLGIKKREKKKTVDSMLTQARIRAAKRRKEEEENASLYSKRISESESDSNEKKSSEESKSSRAAEQIEQMQKQIVIKERWDDSSEEGSQGPSHKVMRKISEESMRSLLPETEETVEEKVNRMSAQDPTVAERAAALDKLLDSMGLDEEEEEDDWPDF
uniref:RNA-directed RNA polymerase L n=1 Tax=Dipteran phenui-related virus OKIAV281 TaxID=2746252 RepID=A0A7D7JZG0_9VIRU|nr:RNA-dependent RNA polymerase [Dipteran phenui-related virus OKIAV281]